MKQLRFRLLVTTLILILLAQGSSQPSAAQTGGGQGQGTIPVGSSSDLVVVCDDCGMPGYNVPLLLSTNRARSNGCCDASPTFDQHPPEVGEDVTAHMRVRNTSNHPILVKQFEV